MDLQLPKPVADYFQADRTGGPGAVASCFTPDAIVIDEGRTHAGRDAIGRWKADASSRFSYTVEPFRVAGDDGRIVVTSHVAGNFPGSPTDLRHVFVLAGAKIGALEIVP